MLTTSSMASAGIGYLSAFHKECKLVTLLPTWGTKCSAGDEIQRVISSRDFLWQMELSKALKNRQLALVSMAKENTLPPLLCLMFVAVRHRDSKEGREGKGRGRGQGGKGGGGRGREGGAESTSLSGTRHQPFGGAGGAVGFSSRSSRVTQES